MVLLGLGVRGGETPVDSFFQQAQGGPLSRLLFLTDERTAKLLLLTTLAVAVYRRLWPVAIAAVVVPVAAWAAVEALKPLFAGSRIRALPTPAGIPP